MIEMMAICTFVIILGMAVVTAAIVEVSKTIDISVRNLSNQCMHIWSQISSLATKQLDESEIYSRISDLEDKMSLLEDDGK